MPPKHKRVVNNPYASKKVQRQLSENKHRRSEESDASLSDFGLQEENQPINVQTTSQTKEKPITKVETEIGFDIKLEDLTDTLIRTINKTLHNFEKPIIQNTNDPNFFGVDTLNVLQDLKDLTINNDTNNDGNNWKIVEKVIKNYEKLIRENARALKNIKKLLEMIQENILKNLSTVVTSNVFPEVEDCTVDNDEKYSDSDVEIINKTFEDIKMPEEHFSGDPNIYAVKTFDVLPDFKNWNIKLTKATFSSDPGPKMKPLQIKKKEMSHAILKKEIHESGEQIFTYCLPTKKTLKKLCEGTDKNKPYPKDNEYEYLVTGEYNGEKKDTDDKYFLVVRPDGVVYNEWETQLSLSKREKKSSVNSKRTIKIPMSKAESIVLKSREKQLQPYYDNEKKEEAEVKKTETNDNSKTIDIKTDSGNFDMSKGKRKRRSVKYSK